MIDILAPDAAETINELARARTLLAFDFDGTLAPITRSRGRAAMRLRTRMLFATLCDLYPCAVISGRSRADVTPRLAYAHAGWVVGNHGMEPEAEFKQFEATIRRARIALQTALRNVEGVSVEDKRLSLSVHYRAAPQQARAHDDVLAAITLLDLPLRIVEGKAVVNVLPRGAPDKGTALVRLCAEAEAELALFVGDDVTDEDAFRLADVLRLVTVRVGADPHTAARWYLRNQLAIDDLLARLIVLRQGARGA